MAYPDGTTVIRYYPVTENVSNMMVAVTLRTVPEEEDESLPTAVYVGTPTTIDREATVRMHWSGWEPGEASFGSAVYIRNPSEGTYDYDTGIYTEGEPFVLGETHAEVPFQLLALDGTPMPPLDPSAPAFVQVAVGGDNNYGAGVLQLGIYREGEYLALTSFIQPGNGYVGEFAAWEAMPTYYGGDFLQTEQGLPVSYYQPPAWALVSNVVGQELLTTPGAYANVRTDGEGEKGIDLSRRGLMYSRGWFTLNDSPDGGTPELPEQWAPLVVSVGAPAVGEGAGVDVLVWGDMAGGGGNITIAGGARLDFPARADNPTAAPVVALLRGVMATDLLRITRYAPAGPTSLAFRAVTSAGPGPTPPTYPFWADFLRAYEVVGGTSGGGGGSDLPPIPAPVIPPGSPEVEVLFTRSTDQYEGGPYEYTRGEAVTDGLAPFGTVTLVFGRSEWDSITGEQYVAASGVPNGAGLIGIGSMVAPVVWKDGAATFYVAQSPAEPDEELPVRFLLPSWPSYDDAATATFSGVAIEQGGGLILEAVATIGGIATDVEVFLFSDAAGWVLYVGADALLPPEGAALTIGGVTYPLSNVAGTSTMETTAIIRTEVIELGGTYTATLSVINPQPA